MPYHKEPFPEEDHFHAFKDLSILLSGIDLAIESVNSLIDIKDKIVASEEFSPQSQRLLSIAYRDIQSNVLMFNTGPSLGLESFSDKNVALEGITDIIKKIWEGIINAIKATWEFITDLFSQKRDEREEKRIDEALVDAKNNKVDLSHEKVPENIFKAFEYLGSSVTLSDIENELNNCVNLLKVWTGFYDVLLNYSLNVTESVALFNEGKTDEAKHYAGVGFQNLHGYVSSYFNKISSSTFDRMNTGTSDDIDKSRVYGLGKFPTGRTAVLYSVKEESSYSLKVDIFKDPDNRHFSFNSSGLTSEHVEHFGNKCKEFKSLLSESTEHRSRKFKQIEKFNLDLVGKIDSSMKKYTSSSDLKTARSINALVKTLTYLLMSSVKVSQEFIRAEASYAIVFIKLTAELKKKAIK